MPTTTRAACKKKIRYANAHDAEQAALRYAYKFGQRRWYQCNSCRKWHLTSQNRLKSKAMTTKLFSKNDYFWWSADTWPKWSFVFCACFITRAEDTDRSHNTNGPD